MVLKKGKCAAPGAALQTGLLSSGYFFGQQENQELPIRPAFLLGLSGHSLVDPAHMRQVQALKQSIELALGKFTTRRNGKTGFRSYRYPG